jgi:hypothetical protein
MLNNETLKNHCLHSSNFFDHDFLLVDGEKTLSICYKVGMIDICLLPVKASCSCSRKNCELFYSKIGRSISVLNSHCAYKVYRFGSYPALNPPESPAGLCFSSSHLFVGFSYYHHHEVSLSDEL